MSKITDLSAVLDAATAYTFLHDGTHNGVCLSGPLGAVAAWNDGSVETCPNVEDDNYRPYHTKHLEKAKAFFQDCLARAAAA